VAGKSYPAGSYIVKSDQAYRPLILDMFEPQDYPNDVKYPGGPPVPRMMRLDGRWRCRWAFTMTASSMGSTGLL
jgi:hypothetical protein